MSLQRLHAVDSQVSRVIFGSSVLKFLLPKSSSGTKNLRD
jgi:hypothetical protein